MEELEEKIKLLEKEYMEYKEADMNKECSKIKTKINRLDKEMKLKKYDEMKRELELIKKDYNRIIRFIIEKGLKYECDNYERKF